VEEQTGSIFSLGQFEETVKQRVIDQLDHKHLNLDVDYFSDLNPTVENIAAAVFEWLDGHFERATLERVRVYETPKTWAECSR
jgi:6-pyruvoyltetrahydropterin/6-carboxytetrahydropterin synthase